MSEEITEQKLKLKIAKKQLKKSIVALIYLLFPVVIAFLIWGILINPITYWQKVFSFLAGIVTWCIVFYIEVEVTS